MTNETYPPIIHLMTALQAAGSDLIESAGYLAGLWHTNHLKDVHHEIQFDVVRRAIAKAAAGLNQYEAATTIPVTLAHAAAEADSAISRS